MGTVGDMTGPLHVLLLASLLGLLHSQLVPVDNEEYLDDVDEIIEENLDDYYPDDLEAPMEKRFDSLFEQKARRKYLTQGRTFMSRPTNIKRTKREFLDELRECRDQIFDAPTKRIKLLENQARVKNVLHSDYQKKRRMKKIGELRRALRDCLREKDIEESKRMYIKKPVQYLRFGR